MGKKKSKPTQQPQTETPAVAAAVDVAAAAAPAKAAPAPAPAKAAPAKKQEAPKKAAAPAATPAKAAPKAAAPAKAAPAKKQEAPKAATPVKVVAAPAAAKKQDTQAKAAPAKKAAVVVAAAPQEVVAVPGFFGHVVAPGQKLQWANEVEEFVLQLNSAALGATVKKGRSTLFVVAKDAKIALCTLVPDAVEQFALAHTFTPLDGAIEFVVEGVNAIHLTGFIDVQDDEDEDDSHAGHHHDFDDSDDESMSSDDDNMMVFGDQSDSELDGSEIDEESSEDRFEVIDERVHGDVAPAATKKATKAVAPAATPAKKAEATPAKKKDAKKTEAAPKAPEVTPASAPLTKKQLAAVAKTEQKIADKVAELTTPPAGGKKRAAPAAASVDVPKKAKTSTREYKGVTIDEASVGKGPAVMKGRKVSILYTGRLESNGKQFDANQNRKKPFTFRHGIGDVIKGMDIGIEGMRAGGKRTITIPAKLGYGKAGAGPSIPGNANLVFDIEML